MVVLDWNLIQSMRAGEDVPARFECVVPVHALHEIATKEIGLDRQAMTKFVRWASRNVHRFWIGRLAERLFARQLRTKGIRLTSQDVVDFRITRRWRRALQNPKTDWNLELRAIKESPAIVYRNRQINELVKFSDAIVAAWGKPPLRQIPRPEDEANWMQLSQFATYLVETRYQIWWRWEWRRYLNEDTPHFAILRWARFLAWYFVKRADGQTKKFANNFDDAHYGLLASYTGHLGTNDRGLEEAARAIFPASV